MAGSVVIGKAGYVASVDPCMATLISLPISWLAKRIGKCAILVAGAASSICVALVVIVVPLASLESLKWGLVFIFMLSGIGRGVFEGANLPQPLWSDHLPSDEQGHSGRLLPRRGATKTQESWAFLKHAPASTRPPFATSSSFRGVRPEWLFLHFRH